MTTSDVEESVSSASIGAPLDTISYLIAGPWTDDVLANSAHANPDQTALVSPSGELTYRQLDERVTRLASALSGLVGQRGSVVALCATLAESFGLGYFAIARSGNVSALINPLLRRDGLVHVLSTSAAQLAIVTPEVYAQLRQAMDRLPALRTVVLTDRGDGSDASLAALPTLAELIASADTTNVVVPADRDGNATACLQFTSGTTGAPKAVRLSHRNLIVNAAQTAHAHLLGRNAVLFNYLPTFHLMHLTAGVAAGATHVLCTEEDGATAAESANRHRATHFYSLPVRLSRLAASPRLPELEIPTLRAILSGGSSLPVPTTTALGQQFGVPVIQGYGLAETSPLTHCDSPVRPRTRSCGQLVAGTESRIVDVDTRAVLPVDAIGEIQVRGPQLMQGYIGRDRSHDVDADGWFSTGDVGYVDAQGYLFVIDRIKDVFKCDNWLVSPTEIERVVLQHPGVADCVVVDYPDQFSGAVAYAIVVARDESLTAAEVTEFVAGQRPYYEHPQHVEFVQRIPRSPNGKVQRRAIRDDVLAREAKR
ncbi:MAG: class I adenylate-forming enzyme family protein [Actinocatenispora sp.]